jgi:hypothetical protein
MPDLAFGIGPAAPAAEFGRQAEKAMLEWARRNLDIDRSDFGRAHGWYVEWRGRRIAALTDPAWDANMQFWHDYKVVALTDDPGEAAALRTEEFWNQPGLVFENRKYGVRVHDELVGGVRPKPDGIILPMRLLYIPVVYPELWRLVDRLLYRRGSTTV